MAAFATPFSVVRNGKLRARRQAAEIGRFPLRRLGDWRRECKKPAIGGRTSHLSKLGVKPRLAGGAPSFGELVSCVTEFAVNNEKTGMIPGICGFRRSRPK